MSVTCTKCTMVLAGPTRAVLQERMARNVLRAIGSCRAETCTRAILYARILSQTAIQPSRRPLTPRSAAIHMRSGSSCCHRQRCRPCSWSPISMTATCITRTSGLAGCGSSDASCGSSTASPVASPFGSQRRPRLDWRSAMQRAQPKGQRSSSFSAGRVAGSHAIVRRPTSSSSSSVRIFARSWSSCMARAASSGATCASAGWRLALDASCSCQII
mmetsp:Transcript_13570/g.34850  ORF Transcript_13570/g.34850 Transcript_13570/m.34850 type:complete len:216 (-) Transcript_13570:193-840(-)